ncbi:MAG: hypothetical protein J7M25_14360 [Deltaproteobacteria bacterium]|nr:hypothetical protein [Deltaproteobacteria bacterium]
MTRRRFFSPGQLSLVESATDRAEELTGDFFRLGRFGPDRYLYEVVTARHLSNRERVQGVFAHLVRYRRVEPGPLQKRRPQQYYRICLQDQQILDALVSKEFGLDDLLLYVMTHELIHVVRFEQFDRLFVTSKQDRLDEETMVYGLTEEILSQVQEPGIQAMVTLYRGVRLCD